MEKLLTISIAAYNAEDYIRETLDSLIAEEYMDLLEVFIVDDGGTDDTLNIAGQYQERFPNTFLPVHKENGGYGSTVNYSIEHATGKYFKLLDGDDWFDTGALCQLIELLKNENSDVVVANYFKGYDKQHLKRVRTHGEKEGVIIDLREGYIPEEPFDMWSLVYKTSLLKENGMVLPTKVLYTDRYYATIPFAYADKVRFTDAFVYCYRVGRDGQSMSVESQLKHYEERVNGSKDLCRFYEEQKKLNNPRCNYLLARVTSSHLGAASVVMHMKKSLRSKKILKNYEKEIAAISRDVIKYERKKGSFGLFVSLCRTTNYLAYWITPDFLLKKV